MELIIHSKLMSHKPKFKNVPEKKIIVVAASKCMVAAIKIVQ